MTFFSFIFSQTPDLYLAMFLLFLPHCSMHNFPKARINVAYIIAPGGHHMKKMQSRINISVVLCFGFACFLFIRKQRCCRAATLKCTRLNCVCGEVTLNPLGTRSETSIIGKKIKLWPNKCALACGGR